MQKLIKLLKLQTVASAAVAVSMLSGCAIGMKMPVKDPVPSTTQYEKPANAAPVALFFSDARPGDNKAASFNNLFGMQMVDPSEKPFDAMSYLSTNIVKELTARGLPVTLAKEAGPNTVSVKYAFTEARRASGFSPYETFTTTTADVKTAKGAQRIVAFVKRGKVPVWGFTEVIDPTFNAPWSIVTKELAAKLNQILFDAKMSDAQVDALVAKTNAATVAASDVYDLAFSNNTRAIPQLVKLSSSKDDEVMHAALAGLGILRSADNLALMIKQAENTKDDWEDRAAALHAIGDLGTPDARAFLQKEAARLEKMTDAESLRTKSLLNQYLD